MKKNRLKRIHVNLFCFRSTCSSEADGKMRNVIPFVKWSVIFIASVVHGWTRRGFVHDPGGRYEYRFDGLLWSGDATEEHAGRSQQVSINSNPYSPSEGAGSNVCLDVIDCAAILSRTSCKSSVCLDVVKFQGRIPVTSTDTLQK